MYHIPNSSRRFVPHSKSAQLLNHLGHHVRRLVPEVDPDRPQNLERWRLLRRLCHVALAHHRTSWRGIPPTLTPLQTLKCTFSLVLTQLDGLSGLRRHTWVGRWVSLPHSDESSACIVSCARSVRILVARLLLPVPVHVVGVHGGCT
jgi:hypothetical protein